MRILDLFCGAGGASVGYHMAGFEVVGVDINPQPNYPFEFHQADAMTFPLEGFDAIHASPPCQHYSVMSSCRPGLAVKYPDLIAATRARLIESGTPYIIENVPGSPLIDPVCLCGRMFGLRLYRHRLFETNMRQVQLAELEHEPHDIPASKAGHWRPGTIMSVSGHVSPITVARDAMGIWWMTRDELSESIPPAYTEHLGGAAMRHLLSVKKVAA